MYCKQCGKEIPDAVSFCPDCGCAQASDSVSYEFVNPVPTPAPIPPKNQTSKGLIIGIAAAVVAVIIIAAAATNGFKKDESSTAPSSSEQTSFTAASAPDTSGSTQSSYIPGTSNNNQSGYIPDTTTTQPSYSQSEYEKLTSKYFYIDIDNPFFMLDCNSYAQEEDGILEVVKIGYKEDIIKEVHIYLYMDTSGLSDAQKEELDKAMRDGYAGYAIDGCCTLAFNNSSNYYSITFIMESLDNLDNLKKISETELFPEFYGVDYISVSETEKELLSGGYVKK